MGQTEHNWEHRGLAALATPFKETTKWDAWSRILLSFVCGVFSAAFFLGGKSRDINDLLIWKGETNKRLEEITSRWEKMDKEGTSRSHWVDEQQSLQIEAARIRASEADKKGEQRGEQMTVMIGKLERLESELKDVKEQIKR